MPLPNPDPSKPAPRDALSIAHAAVWSAFAAHAPLAAMVEKNNRLDELDFDFTTPKPSASDNDVPELAIGQDSVDFGECKSNLDPDAPRDISLVLALSATGRRLGWEQANRLAWLCYAALLKAGGSLGTNCLIQSWTFSGNFARRTSSNGERPPPGSYRAMFIGRLTLRLRVTKQQAIDLVPL